MSETSIANISKKYGITEKAVIDIILMEEIEAFFINEAVRVVKERYSPYQEDRIIFTYKAGVNAGILPDHLKVLRHSDTVKIKILDADGSVTTYLTPPVELSTSRVFVLDDHLPKFAENSEKKPEEPSTQKMNVSGSTKERKNDADIEESKELKTIALLLRYIEDNLKRNQDAVSADLSEGERYKVRGLGKTNLSVIFSRANKELNK